MTHLSIFSLVDSSQKSDVTPTFGDLGQNEKLSEIKPPLEKQCNFHPKTRTLVLIQIPNIPTFTQCAELCGQSLLSLLLEI